MTITVTGIVIMLMGLVVFFYSTKWLYELAVFFVPFSATSVISVGDPLDGSSIQPYMFLAILFIVKITLINLRSKANTPNRINKYLLLARICVITFAIIAAISLIMPAIINGRVQGNVKGQLEDLSPIVFTSRNFTQYLYFLLGLLFSFYIAIYASNQKNLILGIKSFTYSILFVIGWSLVEFTCAKTGLPYPSIIFNNSASVSVAHDISMYEGGMLRLQSVCAEPSIFAQQLVVYLPFILIAIETKFIIFSKTKDMLLALGVTAFIFLCVSSSGIISFAFLILIFLFTQKGIFTKNLHKLLFAILIIAASIPVIYFLASDIIESTLFNKSDSYSALERFGTLTDAWENIIQYPVLGVGWGSIAVYDLFLKILSNTGIIGLIPFFLTIFFIVLQHTILPKHIKENQVCRYLNRACLLSFIVLLFNCEIAGFSFYFGTFWLILGFCIAPKDKLLHS